MIADVYLFLPVGPGHAEGRPHLFHCVEGGENAVDLCLILRDAQQHDILCALPRLQGDSGEADAPHGLPAGDFCSGGDALRPLIDRPGLEEGAPLAEEAVHRGIESHGLFTSSGRAQHIVDVVVLPVALLVKGHGGLHQNAMLCSLETMEHGGHVPVVPDIVRATAVDGDGGDAGHIPGDSPRVGELNLHDLHIVLGRDKGGDLSLEAKLLRFTAHCLPHQADGQGAFVLLFSKAVCLLLGGCPRGRPAALLRDAPEVPGTPAGVEIFRAHRLQ